MIPPLRRFMLVVKPGCLRRDPRAEIIARMRCLGHVFVVEGIQTSIPLHRRILEHPEAAAGRLDDGVSHASLIGRGEKREIR